MEMLDSTQSIESHPAKPDPFSFQQLSRSYNYRTTPGREKLLTKFVVDELRSRNAPRSALDIGCGAGMGSSTDASSYVKQIREHVEVFHGLEPDESVQLTHDCFDDLDHALLEESRFAPNSYDVLYCSLVLEHVADPQRFFAAVEKLLKPGGVFFGLTVNNDHHFTRLAGLAHRLGIDELALRVVRGKSLVEDYHYPVAYKCNSQTQLNRIASDHGFEKPSYVMTERTEASYYFRGPLRPIHWLGALRRRKLTNQAVLLNLFVRLQKQVAN